MSTTTAGPAVAQADNGYADALRLHEMIVSLGKIVRVQTDGKAWWVEYADRFSGEWLRVR